jgi:hypothetical protein
MNRPTKNQTKAIVYSWCCMAAKCRQARGAAYGWQRGKQSHMCGWIVGEFHVGWLCNRRPTGIQQVICNLSL